MNNNEKIEILELYDFNDKNKIDSSNNNDDDDNKNSKIKIWLRTIPLIFINRNITTYKKTCESSI